LNHDARNHEFKTVWLYVNVTYPVVLIIQKPIHILQTQHVFVLENQLQHVSAIN